MPRMSDLWLVVVAAASGCIGAAVGGWASIRATKQTIQAESARWHAEAAERRRDRNLDRRIDLYAEYHATSLMLYQAIDVCIAAAGVPPPLEELLGRLHRPPRKPFHPSLEDADRQLTDLANLRLQVDILATTDEVRKAVGALFNGSAALCSRVRKAVAVVPVQPGEFYADIPEHMAALTRFQDACRNEIQAEADG